MGALATLLFVVTGSAPAYTPPRLEDGRPDLQGNWIAYNRTPLARPDSLTELYITEEQAREIEARGASSARWDGDTLEVETRNFKPDQNRAGDFLISSQTVIVERFALTSHDELNYKFTISDPVHYTQPWTGETQYLRRQGRDLRRRLPRRKLLAQTHPRRRPRARRDASLEGLVADRLPVLAMI